MSGLAARRTAHGSRKPKIALLCGALRGMQDAVDQKDPKACLVDA